MKHGELVSRAGKWLYNTMGCSIVFTEHHSSSYEHPDAIGWANGGVQCHVVEAKTSLPDFYADKRKSSHVLNRLAGNRRWYITEKGLVRPELIPDDHGLLEIVGKRVMRVKEAPFRRDAYKAEEVKMLVAFIRRACSPSLPSFDWRLCEYCRESIARGG